MKSLVLSRILHLPLLQPLANCRKAIGLLAQTVVEFPQLPVRRIREGFLRACGARMRTKDPHGKKSGNLLFIGHGRIAGFQYQTRSQQQRRSPFRVSIVLPTRMPRRHTRFDSFELHLRELPPGIDQRLIGPLISKRLTVWRQVSVFLVCRCFVRVDFELLNTLDRPNVQVSNNVIDCYRFPLQH